MGQIIRQGALALTWKAHNEHGRPGHSGSKTDLIASDVLAAGALQVACEVGLRVPDDISIVGFDATIGRFLSPALTTVSHPLREIGVAACELALSAVAGDPSPRTVKLQTELEIRGSTGPVPPQRRARRAVAES